MKNNCINFFSTCYVPWERNEIKYEKRRNYTKKHKSRNFGCIKWSFGKRKKYVTSKIWTRKRRKEKKVEKAIEETKVNVEQKIFSEDLNRKNDKIELLKEEVEKANAEKQAMQEKLDQAYNQIKEMATKTVEATGGVKILGNSRNFFRILQFYVNYWQS